LAASIRPTPTVGRYYLEGRDIRLGLADGTVTEVLEGALSDQQDLIVGVSLATGHSYRTFVRSAVSTKPG
jgi:hypothetical protein